MQRDAAAATTMGTSAPLADLAKVYMHVSASTMGISFWPSFSFQPPEREPRAGQVGCPTGAREQCKALSAAVPGRRANLTV